MEQFIYLFFFFRSSVLSVLCVFRLLEEGKIQETDKKKDEVEEKQRERRKILAKRGEEHIPRFFRLVNINTQTDLFIRIRGGISRMFQCPSLTGNLWMMLEGKFGCTMEHIGRLGRILDFPMLKTWIYGEECRVQQHCGH